MRSSWNSDEDAALQGLSVEAQVIYLRGLRRYMDFGTGVAGHPGRKISYQGLKETITPERDWGSNKKEKEVTKGFVRARLTELKRAGLIQDAGSNRVDGLVVRLVLADTGVVRSKKERHRNDTGEQHTEQHSAEPVKRPEEQQVIGGVGAWENTGNNTGQTPRNDTHPGTGNTVLYFARESVPEKPAQWLEFFSRQGFPHHRVQTASTVPMFAAWCKQQISTGLVLEAMEIAHSNLNGRPDTPKYYDGFVQSLSREYQRRSEGHQHEQRSNQPSHQRSGARVSTVQEHSERAQRYIDSLGLP